MNVVRVASELKEFANDKLKDGSNIFEFGEKTHLIGMCDKILSGEVADEKAHRWIGWIQGCLYMTGITSLEEMKLVNKGG